MALKKKKQGTALDKAKARFKRMQDGDRGNKDFAQPVTGKNVFRILPGAKEDDDWYVEAAYHYNLGPNKLTKLCPAFVGRKCPACTKSAAARKEAYKLKDQYEKGGEKSLKLKKAMDKAFRIASAFKAKNKFYMNVVPLALGKETQSGKEVKILGIGMQIMNGIFTFYTDTDEFGNVLDLKKGRDFIITKKITGKNAWDVDYDVKLRDKDRCKAVHPNRLKDLNDLTQFVKEYPDAAEILSAMEGREDESSDDDDDHRRRSKLTKKKKKGKSRDEEDEDSMDAADESSEEEDESSDEESDETSDEGDDDDEEEERSRKKKKGSKLREKLRRKAKG